MTHPTFNEEMRLKKKGYGAIAGVDEAGRGPLAGPVVAAAVIISGSAYQDIGDKELRHSTTSQFNDWDLLRTPELGFKILMEDINDSKKLSPKRREKLYEIIISNPLIKWGAGIVSEKTIDEINILEASLLAMKLAIEKLKIRPDFILLDGNHLLQDYPVSQAAVVKGDQKVFSIAAASIIAKVIRDRMMMEYHVQFPNYGFDKHKGYGTAFHMEMLAKYGPSDIHRLSFAPVKEVANKK